MANAVSTAYKAVMVADGAFSAFALPNWESDTINFALIDTATDTVAPQTDQDLADFSTAIVAEGPLLTVTAVASGANVTIDAANITLPTVTGDSAEQVAFYHDTGTPATSLLLIVFDTFTSGMPVTPNGGDIVGAFHASGLWQL
jgi:hypothetical protein